MQRLNFHIPVLILRLPTSLFEAILIFSFLFFFSLAIQAKFRGATTRMNEGMLNTGETSVFFFFFLLLLLFSLFLPNFEPELFVSK